MEKPSLHPFTELLRRWPINRHVSLSLIAIVIGILAAYGAILFRLTIKFTQYLFYGNASDFLTFAEKVPLFLKIGLPAAGGLLVGLLVYLGAPEVKGPGVPEIMEAVALREGRIRPRVALIKIIASSISIGCGGSLGREGPIIQIGSSIGSTLAQVLKMSAFKQRTLVGCGAAAGIAATFNAPIAGTLFAAEVILGDFGMATFSPLVLSSVTATAISRHYLGNFPAFLLPSYALISGWELLLYPFLGVAAGIVGLLFMAVLGKSGQYFDALKIPEYLKPAAGGLLLGLLLLRWPQVFGVGYGTINLALQNQLTPVVFLSLIFVKTLATSISLGSGKSGGVFAPSLFLGAMTGGFLGWIFHGLFPGVTAGPGAYALVSMGALVACTTHAPITAIIIIFELTGTYEVILPLMMTCIISTLITSTLKKDSIYTMKLTRRGVTIPKGWEQRILHTIKVRDVMNERVVTVREDTRLDEVISFLKVENVACLFVVDDEEKLTGIISFRDIRPFLLGKVLRQRVAGDVASREIVGISPSGTVHEALHRMGQKNVSQLPVLAEDGTGKIVGIITEKDAVAAYDQRVTDLEEERF